MNAEDFLAAPPNKASAEDFLGTPGTAESFLGEPPSPEVVAQEAQKASGAALQAVDVMNLPGKFDLSGPREEIDKQRLQEAYAAEAQAKLAIGHSPSSYWVPSNFLP
jgi:hypothetical protein